MSQDRKPQEAKTAGLRLFGPADELTPIHSWRALLGQASCGLVNPRGWALLHVVVQKFENGTGGAKDLYDQVVIVENPGAVVVCRAADKVGLVQSFRFTAERLAVLKDANKDYVARLAAEGELGLWDYLLESLGRWQWELPRGMSPAAAGADLTRYILETARVEAEEEGGFEITNARIVGRVNPNSTFFVHSQYVVSADIQRTGTTRPEELELIGKVRLFSPEELRELADRGEFEDGLSLAALALAGFSF